jgi:hypothetical protein
MATGCYISPELSVTVGQLARILQYFTLWSLSIECLVNCSWTNILTIFSLVGNGDTNFYMFIKRPLDGRTLAAHSCCITRLLEAN